MEERTTLVSVSLSPSPPPLLFRPFSRFARSPRLRSVLLLINGGPAIFFSPATHSLGSVFLLLDVSFSFSRRKNSSRLINVSVARPLVPTQPQRTVHTIRR